MIPHFMARLPLHLNCYREGDKPLIEPPLVWLWNHCLQETAPSPTVPGKGGTLTRTGPICSFQSAIIIPPFEHDYFEAEERAEAAAPEARRISRTAAAAAPQHATRLQQHKQHPYNRLGIIGRSSGKVRTIEA